MDRVMNRRYAGAILYLDNLKQLARGNPARLARFFDDIRDCLQTPRIHFVFVGYMGMFQNDVHDKNSHAALSFSGIPNSHQLGYSASVSSSMLVISSRLCMISPETPF